jgi:hypothetical protein
LGINTFVLATVRNIQALLTKREKGLKYSQVVAEDPRMVFDLLHNPKTCAYIQHVLMSTDYKWENDDDNYQLEIMINAAAADSNSSTFQLLQGTPQNFASLYRYCNE